MRHRFVSWCHRDADRFSVAGDCSLTVDWLHGSVSSLRTKTMKVADYIAAVLERNRVRQVYELIGGMTTHLVDSIHNRRTIRIVCMHHEQAAAFAAEGSARMTGIPGVALATSGPGATNLLTGVASCFFDSVPVVFITGQVNRNEMRKSHGVRQQGFQETDIVTMAKPITKGAWLVEDPTDVPSMLCRAFELAVSDRPGPVLLDIPMDVQRAEIRVPERVPMATPVVPNSEIIGLDQMMTELAQADRPIILAGGGIRSGQAAGLFRQFVDRMEIPVVHSLMGVDVLPYDHPMKVGMIGTYGNRWANHALQSSDWLLVVGSRLDVRQVGADVEAFARGKTIWHVDIDGAEINNRVKGCHAIPADIRQFLESALEETVSDQRPRFESWRAEIRDLREQWPDTGEQPDLPGINPNVAMHRLSRLFPQASAFVSDVGQHQMWAAQSLELREEQRFLTSGGMGSMGFALPAAVGVATSCPGQPVVAIAGDGGFQCNIQELDVVARDHLPVKMVIVNNKSLGMVRQFQEAYFESRLQSTVWGYSAPDFVAIAEAYGISAHRVERTEDLDERMTWLGSSESEPALLEMCVDPKANAYPKTVFGKPLTEMEPPRGAPCHSGIFSACGGEHRVRKTEQQRL